MTTLGIGDPFPETEIEDIDGETVRFPEVFAGAPATVVFLYRGRW
jgi:peroxiredoxin